MVTVKRKLKNCIGPNHEILITVFKKKCATPKIIITHIKQVVIIFKDRIDRLTSNI